jgi:hypothetical protein
VFSTRSAVEFPTSKLLTLDEEGDPREDVTGNNGIQPQSGGLQHVDGVNLPIGRADVAEHTLQEVVVGGHGIVLRGLCLLARTFVVAEEKQPLRAIGPPSEPPN